jgi:hypothetical protein
MVFTYRIDSDNAVLIYSDAQPNDPIILQPNWPDGTPWASSQEASTWAESLITSMTNPDSPRPLSGPNVSNI